MTRPPRITITPMTPTPTHVALAGFAQDMAAFVAVAAFVCSMAVLLAAAHL
jgi:hypothetical protein